MVALCRYYTSQQEWDDEHGLLATCSYPVLSLSEESAARWPKLAQAVSELSDELDEDGREYLPELAQWAREELEYNPDYFIAFFDEVNATVRRADARVLSLLMQGSSYTGGVHPNHGWSGVNLDPATGEELEITDVVTDVADLLALVEARLPELYPETSFFSLHDSLQTYVDEPEYLSWTLDYQGVSVWFSPYEIASYADGMLTVLVPFDQAPELFIGGYDQTPEHYAVEMDYSDVLRFDLDGDGTQDTLQSWGEMNEYGDYESVTFTVNGARACFDLHAFQLLPTLVYLGPGQTYLYLETLVENDYSDLYFYQVMPGGTLTLGTQFCGIEGVLTDPDSFQMSERTDLVSTVWMARTCHVGPDGLPVPESADYTILSQVPLTVKTPFPANQLDADGQTVLGQTELPVGTVCTPLRTDGESWVTVQASDGQQYRLEVNADAWPHRVNGLELEEAFDGVLFAG